MPVFNPPSGAGTHAATHVTGGGDTIADAVAAGNSGLMSGADKTKLDGIAAGAEVNVNADWNSGAGDSQILNKPTLGTAAAKNIPASGNASATEVVYGSDTRLSDARTPATHDSTKHSVTYALPADTMYIGTTAHALNRASASEALTGITSIDGSAATLTTARNIGGRSFNGSADIIGATRKCGITTRDITTASGTVNVAHGLGRVPSYVKVYAFVVQVANTTECIGIYDGTNHCSLCTIYQEGTTTATTDTTYSSTSYELGFSAATVVNPYTGANRQNAVITVDATNIIFTWTKTGTVATAVANILWEVG